MTESNKRPRCTTCNATFERTDPDAVFPFCSKRCRTIDLGSWLDERYRLPDSEGESSDEPELLH